MITFCLTSCGRPDLLEKTLDSFLKFNTYPIEEFLVIDDSGDLSIYHQNQKLIEKYSNLPFTWVHNTKNKGQIYSVDRLYKEVKTDWIFHCEDDWEFTRSGFIEESLAIMQQHPKCLQVWLRDLNDTNGHPVITGRSFGKLDTHYVWKGFTFNPTLKRMKDYKPYSTITKHKGGGRAEHEIGLYYYNQGFWCAILNQGAVKHIGWEDSANKKMGY